MGREETEVARTIYNKLSNGEKKLAKVILIIIAVEFSLSSLIEVQGYIEVRMGKFLLELEILM